MARPLTKLDLNGAVYARPTGVEAQIDEAIRLTQSELEARLLVVDRSHPDYLRHECLVHLVREGRRSEDQALMGAVLPILLGRCEANLLVKVPDGAVQDAASLRQEVLDELTDLFVMDGFGDGSDQLDFYECRFNKAFRTLRIDAIRRAERRCKREGVVDISATDADGQPESYEDTLARLSEAFRTPPPQEWSARREPILDAIDALPPKEREALVLVRVLGYKEESEDPNEETAATRSQCTGRTIRNRLTRAAAKLSRFKEDL